MAFVSAAFLFFFLPLLLIIEALIRPVRAKNVFLCLAGLLFYSFGELWALAQDRGGEGLLALLHPAVRLPRLCDVPRAGRGVRL